VLVRDCLVNYDDVCDKQHKCYAHHLKAIRGARQSEPESVYLQQWKQLVQHAIAWKNQQSELSADAYQNGYIKLAIQSVELLRSPLKVQRKNASGIAWKSKLTIYPLFCCTNRYPPLTMRPSEACVPPWYTAR